jgi:hypothetical protein
MARSVLPPIEWPATCGHRNEVRSDLGGFKVACKTCGANIWCPKRKSARPAARTPGRPAAVAARPVKASALPAQRQQVATWPEVGGSKADAAILIARMAGRLVGGQPCAAVAGAAAQVAVRPRQQQPAERVLEGVVVDAPGTEAAERQAAEVESAERAPIVARLMQLWQRDFNAAALAPGVYLPCAGCRAEMRRTEAGRFPDSAATVELSVEPWQVNVCREHLAMVRNLGVLVKARSLSQPPPPRRASQVRRVAYRYPKPPRIPVAPIKQPNTQVLAISGDYTGQLAASLSSAAVSLPGPRQRRALSYPSLLRLVTMKRPAPSDRQSLLADVVGHRKLESATTQQTGATMAEGSRPSCPV